LNDYVFIVWYHLKQKDQDHEVIIMAKEKVVVERLRVKRKPESFAEIMPQPIMFGFGLLPDGTRIAIESYDDDVKVGGRYEAEKVIGQNKYVIGKKKKK
jgi:hypothetical protein